MCCLAYEQPAYEYLNRITPGVGSIVKTPEGVGAVVETNVISGTLRVRMEPPSHRLRKRSTRTNASICAAASAHPSRRTRSRKRSPNERFCPA